MIDLKRALKSKKMRNHFIQLCTKTNKRLLYPIINKKRNPNLRINHKQTCQNLQLNLKINLSQLQRRRLQLKSILKRPIECQRSRREKRKQVTNSPVKQHSQILIRTQSTPEMTLRKRMILSIHMVMILMRKLMRNYQKIITYQTLMTTISIKT